MMYKDISEAKLLGLEITSTLKVKKKVAKLNTEYQVYTGMSLFI